MIILDSYPSPIGSINGILRFKNIFPLRYRTIKESNFIKKKNSGYLHDKAWEIIAGRYEGILRQETYVSQSKHSEKQRLFRIYIYQELKH